MSEELDRFEDEEQRLGGLFAAVQPPESMRRWDCAPLPSARARRWGSRLLAGLIGSPGERRLRPLAAALVVPVAVLAVGGGVGLRAHFTSTAGSGDGPPARENAAMAFDAARGEMVMFGGRDTSRRSLDDTWTWDGDSWTEQHPATSPPGADAVAMGYDDQRHEVVLFESGGLPMFGNSLSTAVRTWAWDGSTWTPVATKHVPDVFAPAMALDPERHQLLLVGGANAQNPEMANQPRPVFQGGVVSGSNQMILPPPRPAGTPAPLSSRPPQPIHVEISGSEGGQLINRNEMVTWLWSGSDWLLQRSRPASGDLLSPLSPAWDSSAHRVVMVSMGELAQCRVTGTVQAIPAPRTVVVSPTPGFTRYAPLPSTPLVTPILPSSCTAPRPYDSMPVHEWSWDGSQWQAVQLGASKPPQRLLSDPAHGGVVGVGSAGLSRWDGSAKRWTLMRFPAGLANRSNAAIAADSERHQLVLFGGQTFAGVLAADTWTWDGSTWTHRAGDVPPPSTPRPLPSLQSIVQATPAGCTGPVPVPVVSVASAPQGVVITIRHYGAPAPCPVTAQLEDATTGTPLDVLGNGQVLSTSQVQTLRWLDWCGSAQEARLTLRSGGASVSTPLAQVPPCTDRLKPSVLAAVEPGATLIP